MTTSAVLIVLLMMGAGSIRNMLSNLAEKNKKISKFGSLFHIVKQTPDLGHLSTDFNHADT
jgi:hypothetical protein